MVLSPVRTRKQESSMGRTTVIIAFAWIALGLWERPADAQEGDQTALAARSVFKQHCHRCHSGAGSEGGEFDVLDVKTLTAKRDSDQTLIVPGKSAESYIIERVFKNSMPPKAIKERPTDEDKAALKQWVDAGAPPFPSVQRKYLATKD